jgi:TolA-binding protein
VGQLTALQELPIVRFDFQKQQQASKQELQEQRQRQQLYRQLNVHLRELHLQRQQQQQLLLQENQESDEQELQEEQHKQQEQQFLAGDAAAATAAAVATSFTRAGADVAGMPDAAVDNASAFVIRPDMLELVHAIASLPNLRSLELKRIRLGNAAAQLAAATQLTHVRLEDCGMLDPAARQVVQALTTVG